NRRLRGRKREPLRVTVLAVPGRRAVVRRPGGQPGEAGRTDLPGGGVTATLVSEVIVVAATKVAAAPPGGVLALVLRVVDRESPRVALRHVEAVCVALPPCLELPVGLLVVTVKDADYELTGDPP